MSVFIRIQQVLYMHYVSCVCVKIPRSTKPTKTRLKLERIKYKILMKHFI